jgi:hypothetical protein
LEDIFERQGFEISRATQSVWRGDMAERVRQSHVVATDDTTMPMLRTGQTKPARMWVPALKLSSVALQTSTERVHPCVQEQTHNP